MKVLAKLKKEPGLWLSEATMPVIHDDTVLVKIKKTAICGTDLHIYNWDAWAQKTVPVPLTTGHEFMGVVELVGKDVKGIKPGDRVSGEGHITCGYCRNCRGGNRHLCRNTQGVGYNITGAFSEYFAMPESNIVKLPDNISDEIGAVLDPFGNAVHTALEFNVIGEDVLITGAGPVGLFAAAIVRHIGARLVVIVDVNEYRLDLARKLGVTKTVNLNKENLQDVMKELGMQEGFDVGLEMSGNEHAFHAMLDVMNYGGNIAFLGIPPKPFEVDWSEIVFKSITIRGIYGRRMYETWYKGIAMLQSGLSIMPVITHQYSVDSFEEGFELMKKGLSGKVILNWD